MKIVVFGARSYDCTSFQEANGHPNHELVFLEPHLNAETAVFAGGAPAVCAFVNDLLDRSTLKVLSRGGTRLIALRCSGFNNVDLDAAAEFGLTVARVPAYSPHAIAEFAVGMMLTLNRKIHRANNRVREGNFSLDGLAGFDLHGRTVGVVGSGFIGALILRAMNGFGCRLLAHDLMVNESCVEFGARYVSLDEMFARSDVISLYCPLTPSTSHLINDASIAKMKSGMMLIITSRGAVVDARAAIRGLKSGRIGYLGLDVYEEEAAVFFEDGSDQGLSDDVLARLLTFPNVLITGHQAFLPRDALHAIAQNHSGKRLCD